MKIVTIETAHFGNITPDHALSLLSEGRPLNNSWGQIVMGVWEDGRKTSLQGKRDGFLYLSGKPCTELARHPG